MDIEKQIAYWQHSAVEDWDVAQDLIEQGRARHGLFFAHLTLEKLLKAHVCHATQDLAPRTHNLVRLAELTALAFSAEQIDLLADMNAFNLEGRYPDSLTLPPSMAEATDYLRRTASVYTWLIQQLSTPSKNI
ncbi:MAG: HEPN domain-containing protein [Anaerolineales bacterium]|nr:HEPN domain-containing protein [Anaerolineales bacterium]